MREAMLPALLVLGLVAAAAPTWAQSQAGRTGHGGAVAGQELPEYPGLTMPVLVAGGIAAAVLGAYLAVTASDSEEGAAAPAGLITATTTTIR